MTQRGDLTGLGKAQLRRRLAAAIKAGHVWPAFQPIIDINSGTIVGFEILARWSDPDLGEIGPPAFIPLLEKHRLMNVLTDSLVRTACTAAAGWPGSVFLAFNISPDQLLSADLPDIIAGIAAETGFPLSRIEIEVTEGSLISDDEQAYETLRRFDAYGVSISIDDFGTGYSSLKRLEAFPFRKLKIDACFVKSIDHEPGKRRIAAAVIGLAQSLGMTVVAEGVESRAEEAILRSLGCTFGQGWLYGRGVPAREAAALAAKFSWADALGALMDASPFQRLHQLETLYEQAPVGLCFLDLQLRHVRANDAFAAIHKLTPAQLEGKRVDDIIAGAPLEQVKGVLRQALEGPSPPQDYRVHDRDFRVFTQKVVDVGGDVIGFSVVSIDVTEQNQLVERLTLSERHFRHLVEVDPHIAWGADAQGLIDYMSPSAGDPVDEPMQARIDRWHATMHPVDRLRVRAEWLQWLPAAKPFRTTFRILWRDGCYRWVESMAHPQPGPTGEAHRWCGMIRNLPADHATADDALPEASPAGSVAVSSTSVEDPEALLFGGLLASEAPVAVFAPDDRLVFASAALREIYDLQPGEQTFESLIRHCHGTGRGALVVAENIETWLAAASSKRRSQTHRRFEVDTIDGRWFWASETVFNQGWIMLTLTDMTALKKTEAELRVARDAALQLVETDALTGLQSRRAIMEYLDASLCRATAAAPVSVAIIDIDHFKQINDRYGHDVGDEVLQVFGAKCGRVLRNGDRIGRIGGEEFLLVMPGTCEAAAEKALERLRSAFRQTDFEKLEGGRVSFSGGVAQYEPGQTIYDLYKNADRALYNAKTSGRDRISSLRKRRDSAA